jgi:hypothetical protein
MPFYTVRDLSPFQTSSLVDRDLYRNRTWFQDYFQTYLHPFIAYAMQRPSITEADLLRLQDEDKTEAVFREWCHNGSIGEKGQAGAGDNIHTVIKRLTIRGIAKYSLQLVVVEVSQIASIYMIRVIIEYL